MKEFFTPKRMMVLKRIMIIVLIAVAAWLSGQMAVPAIMRLLFL